MPLGLLRYGLARRYPAQRFFPMPGELRPSYDVVIIGAGGVPTTTPLSRNRMARAAISRDRAAWRIAVTS